MGWLRDQGHPIIGIELSEIAARSFFEERGQQPTVEHGERFLRFTADDIVFLVGDFFALRAEDLEQVRGLYDRAALIALPVPMRAKYAEHLASILQTGVRGLVITIEYDTTRMKGPPFSVPDRETEALLAPEFEVRLVEEESGPEVAGPLKGRGLETLREAVFKVDRRP